MTPGTTISVLTGLAWIAATGYVALDFVSAEQARITARNISGGGMNKPTGPKADFSRKLVSAERALASIPAGSRIYVGTGCAAPRTLLAELEAMVPEPPDLEFVSFVTTSALPQAEGATRTRYRHRAFFVGSEVRGLAKSGQLDYVPISLEEVPELLTSGRLPIDVALLQVSPPDARGFVSLGVSVDLAPAVLSVARSVIPRSIRRCRAPAARASFISIASMRS